MKPILGTLALLLPAWAAAAPVEIARESFEGTAGSIGYTASYTFDSGTGTSGICAPVPNNGNRISGGRIIAGTDGTRFFEAVRVNRTSASPGDNAPAPLTVTTNAVSIAGKVNTSVRLLLAAPGDSLSPGTSETAVYDLANPLSASEYIRIEASIDGGAYVFLGQYSPTALNTALSFDATGNLSGGDPVPPGLTAPATLDDTLREAIFPVPTGNNVQVRLSFYSNGSSEYILFDNLRIFGENVVTPPPVIGGVPAGALNVTEGDAAKPLAPALTLTDADSATLTTASVAITQNFNATEDVLAATPSGAILAGDITFTGGVLTIARSAPIADYQAVLRSVTYRNSNLSNPATATRQVTFSANDGVNPSNAPVREIIVVDLVPVQNLPYTESFETEGRGTRYAVTGGFLSGNSLFSRVNPNPDVPGTDGVQVFAVEHTQSGPAPATDLSVQLNTQGYANLKLKLLAAVQGGNVFEQADDFLRIETSKNGGAWETLRAFRSTGPVNGALALDENLDGTGEGTALTASFQEFTFDLPTANTLGVRLVAATDGTGERILFDNLRVDGQLSQFAIANQSASESAGTIGLTVTRSGSTAGAATLNYTLAAGTATAGTDFNATGGTVNFIDSQATATLSVPVVNDNIVELDETFTVTLSDPSVGTITTATATATIQNDDAAAITLTAADVTEGDSGTVPMVFTVHLSKPVDVAVTFDRATLTTGTATAGTDFTALAAAPLTVPAGDTTATFNVTILGDDEVEPNESVNAALTNLAASGRNVAFDPGTGGASILDDDPLLVAGSGALGVKIGVSGKLKVSDLLALTTGGEGRPLSLVSVQSGFTPGGGTVTLVEGWIYYQPGPGFTGTDSYTFTITDGVQTVTGTVSVVTNPEAGATLNIYLLANEGAGKRVFCLGIPGRRYGLQTSPDLNSWSSFGAPVFCPAAGAFSILDPGPLPPTRFYRVVELPLPL